MKILASAFGQVSVLVLAVLALVMVCGSSVRADDKSWGGPKGYNATEKGQAVELTDLARGFDWHQLFCSTNNTNGTASNSSAYWEVVAVCNFTNLGPRNQTLNGSINATDPIPITFKGRFAELWVVPVGMDIEDVVSCVEYMMSVD